MFPIYLIPFSILHLILAHDCPLVSVVSFDDIYRSLHVLSTFSISYFFPRVMRFHTTSLYIPLLLICGLSKL